uniref:Protein TIC 214 n=1 Tax=Oxalis corniculata TaxID=212256 RepID=A0A7G7YES6_OXACO|nr:hypothetical chloroplast RF19 [Oxalis corniculata]QNH92996.1 hypothetical chloroplast RF19 [Oxalis corniculata]
MILKSFILGNLVSFSMKLINSVVVVGLYYGFLTTFSIGPSYLFLLRARVMEEGTEKKVSATTGFITGQLMMFISIYYAPLHLALGRPHTITVLALPYLLFHFFWNNHKHFFDYGSTTRNSMRNLSIQCVFLNNLIFQLFNHFILPSSMLVRLVNIYMFRCNNKMLFVTSSFVGWLIGHILFMKWLGLVLVWIQQKNSIRSNVLIRSNKYLVSELRNSMARIFSILLFITCVYYLGRMPSPIFTKKLKETEERGESEEETDVEIETTSESKQLPNGNKRNPPKKILLLPFFRKKRRIRTKWMKRKKSEWMEKKKQRIHSTFTLKRHAIKRDQMKSFIWMEIKKNLKLLIRLLQKVSFLLFDLSIFFSILTAGIVHFDIKKPINLKLPKETKCHNIFFIHIKVMEKKDYFLCIHPVEQLFLKRYKKECFCKRTNKFPLLNCIILGLIETHKNGINKTRSLKTEKKAKIIHFLLGLDSKKELDYVMMKLKKNTYIKYMILKGAGSIVEKNGFHVQFQTKLPEKIIGNFGEIKFIVFLLLVIINILKKNEIYLIENSFQEKCTLFGPGLINFPKNQIKNSRHFQNMNKKKWTQTIYKKFKSFYLIQGLGTIRNFEKDLFKKKKSIKKSLDGHTTNKLVIKNKKRDKLQKTWLKRMEFVQEKLNVKKFLPLINKMLIIVTKRVLIQKKQKKWLRYVIHNNQTFVETKSKVPSAPKDAKWSLGSFFKQMCILPPFKTEKANPFFFLLISTNKRKLCLSIGKVKRKSLKSKSQIIQRKKKKRQKKVRKKKRTKEKKTNEKRGHEEKEQKPGIVKYLLKKYGVLCEKPTRLLENRFKYPYKKKLKIRCVYYYFNFLNGLRISRIGLEKSMLNVRIMEFNYLKKNFQKIGKPTVFRKRYYFLFVKNLGTNRNHNFLIRRKKKNKKTIFVFKQFGGWELETELPFGSPKKRLSLFEPVFKKLQKKSRKLKKKCFLGIKSLKERTEFFLNKNLLNETTKKLIKNILFFKKLLKEISKRKRIPFFGFRKIYELNEIQKDSILKNRVIQESSIQIQSISWYSLTEKKMKDLTDRTSEIRNTIEKITKDKKNKKIFLTREKNISLKKKNYDHKSLGSTTKKLQILKIRHASVIRKSHYLIKMFIEKIYITIALCIINITKIRTQVFHNSKNNSKSFDKYVYYNKENKKKIHGTNINTIRFISTTRKLLSNKNLVNTKSKNFCNLSLVSQAYVFYKLSQTQIIDFYKLRSVLEYHGTSLFLKNEIKDFFGTQGIFNSELRYTKLSDSITNPWKIWLRTYYQYDLPHIRWSRLISKKCRNKTNHPGMSYNKALIKENSYKNDQLIYEKKQKDFEADLLLNQKEKLKKNSKYDLLAYKSINSEDKKNSYIYGSTLEVTNKKDYFFNYNARKRKFFDTLEGIPRNNYLGEDDIMDMDKNPDKKYFGWRILNFCLRKRVDIESWIDTGTKNNKNIKIGTHNYQTNNYQIIDKIDTKDLFYLTIHQDQNLNPSKNINIFFDWMGMNEKILRHSISNLKFMFLPKFGILYDIYKMKPWIIPIKLLLLSFNKNSIKKTIKRKKKEDLFISSTKKNFLKLENQNKEFEDQAIFGSIFSKPEKDLKEDYVGSDLDTKKSKKNRQYKVNTKVDLFFFLKRYLRFQLRWENSLSLNQRIINNIKIYCLLLRLITPKEIVISSIQREEMSLDIMIIQKDLTFTEVMKKAILIIEPIRLSVKNDEKFLMYQTINISLIHKSKQQINQSYGNKSYVDKNYFAKYISRHQKAARKKDKNCYDLFVPENILSPKHRKELRIVSSFNSKNKGGIHRNTEFCNEIQTENYDYILDDKSKRDKNKLIKLKFFLWPNYRLEDLACMNRYWFDTTNGSHFSMIRMHMYTRFKINY